MTVSPALSSRVAAFFLKRIRVVAAATLLATVAGFFGRLHRLLELTCHFRLQYLWTSALCAIALLIGRDWKWGSIALSALLLNAVVVVPWYFPGGTEAASRGMPFRVLLSNVYTANTNTAAVLDLIRSENADVVVLQEVDARWASQMQPLDAILPHSKVISRQDNFGIGIWSRYPFRLVQEIASGDYEIPSIIAQVDVAGHLLWVVATHPPPPVRNEMFIQRNAQLATLATLLKATGARTILLGDLNLTMWSPFYASFMRESGLQNARKGFGVLPTWPTQLPFLGIPLDQCLVSPDIQVKAIRRGKHVGSDHRPIIADLLIPPPR